MELSPFIIYLWGIADGVRSFSALVAGLVFLSFFASGFASTIGADDFSDSTVASLKRVCSLSGIALLFAGTMAILVPPSKTIAIMVIAPAIINSEPIQKDLPELYDMAVDAIKSNLAPDAEKK